MKNINIDGRIIGELFPPMIIAEMSGNHNKSLDRALEIVDEAARCGAHAIKLQTYTPDTMTMPGAFTINDEDSLWKGRELYDLYKDAYTPWDWHKPIFERAKSKGLIAFSTPFDETSVDFLESLGVPAYKIASFENTDWPLLKKVAATKKPIIMSTGAAKLSEIDEAVSLLHEYGCEDLILLKCTSTYPASPETTNLLTIPHMSTMFNCHVGLSDHTLGIGVALASVALGSRVIEKHFTLQRSDGGVDSAFSIEPDELHLLVDESVKSFLAIGQVSYGVQKKEEKSRVFKRSLIASEEIKKGDQFSDKNIKVLRPGLGIESKFIDKVLGRVSRVDISKGSPIKWEDL